MKIASIAGLALGALTLASASAMAQVPYKPAAEWQKLGFTGTPDPTSADPNRVRWDCMPPRRQEAGRCVALAGAQNPVFAPVPFAEDEKPEEVAKPKPAPVAAGNLPGLVAVAVKPIEKDGLKYWREPIRMAIMNLSDRTMIMRALSAWARFAGVELPTDETLSGWLKDLDSEPCDGVQMKGFVAKGMSGGQVVKTPLTTRGCAGNQQVLTKNGKYLFLGPNLAILMRGGNPFE